MGVRLPQVSSNAIVSTAPVTVAETIIAQVGPINLSLENQQVMLFAYCLYTTGAGNTGVIFRLRRGNALTSPQLNVSGTINIGANVIFSVALHYPDFGAGAGAALFYVLTYQAVGAGGNATISDVALTAMCL